MHVEVRTQGKKKKYYLAHSFRRGKNVRKIRFYLGSNLTENDVEKKRKYAEKSIKERMMAQEIIRDPFRTVLAPKEMDEIQTLGTIGDLKILHLSEENWVEFTKLFAYDTNAIEGSTVTASEVKNILEKDRVPKDKPQYEIAETYGVSDAIAHIRTTKEHISLDLIKGLHKIVFKNSKDFAGKFRPVGVEVAVVDAAGKTVHQGAPSAHVIGLLEELVKWYHKNKNKYTPIVLAAVVHNQFENIHPFQDGNGRVGRLLLNNILIKHKLPPVNIELKNRTKYYNALQEYENKENLRPTIELILKEYHALKKIIDG